MHRLSSILKLSLNPWVISASLALGLLFGVMAPEMAQHLGVVGNIYVDLLKMVVLPFMVSAVIFSMQRLLREGETGALLGRVVWVLAAFSCAAVLLAAGLMQLWQPGTDLSDQTKLSFGQIIGANHDLTMSLYEGSGPQASALSLQQLITSLIPSNVFASLSHGETLKVMVFSLLFGLAVGRVPNSTAHTLSHTLDTVYKACQVLTKWFNVPLPLVLFAMTAHQVSQTGYDAIRAMAPFVLNVWGVTLAMLMASIWIIQSRTGLRVQQVLSALREPFFVAAVTRNSVTCMPSMIEALAGKLRFPLSTVELLVPLTTSILRTGQMAYYVCATMFIAQIYDRTLTGQEVALVLLVSILTGIASAGMTGLVTLSLIGTTAGYLGLPFEAAFILFVAVDPMCDLARTLMIVIPNCGAVALLCPTQKDLAKPPP